MSKLKGCPKCRNPRPKVIYWEMCRQTQVICEQCGFCGKPCVSRGEAVKFWQGQEGVAEVRRGC